MHYRCTKVLKRFFGFSGLGVRVFVDSAFDRSNAEVRRRSTLAAH